MSISFELVFFTIKASDVTLANPTIVVTVVPDVITVVPKVGALYPAEAACHSRPVAVAELTAKTYPLVVAAASLETVSFAVPTSKSPLASITDFAIAALAKSYAVLTELGVAAVVTDVLAVESVSCTAPDCAVVAA